MSEQWPTAIGPGRSRNHIPENGQHQLGRETNSPGAEPYPDALQAVWVGAPAPRENIKPRQPASSSPQGLLLLLPVEPERPLLICSNEWGPPFRAVSYTHLTLPTSDLV